MNKGYFATLVRGLCIDLTGKPNIVTSCVMDIVPEAAMKVTVTQQESMEEYANIIRSAYTKWKSENKTSINPGEVLLPSCVALCENNIIATFWIGPDIDSARKRLSEKDASPWIESVLKNQMTLNCEERAAVVKNRITLVTGGAQGIGKDIVNNLCAVGALVFIADMNLKNAELLAKDINTSLGRCAAIAVEVDVSDEASVEKMFNTVAQTAGGLDLCVSNAGVLKAGSVLEQALSDFKFVTDINYTGFFLVSKFAGQLLRTQHLAAPSWKTDIVQINSKSGLEGSNKNGAYAGGKFGGLGLVASFAMELVEYNIKVNALCPGNFLDGPLWSDPDTGLFVQYLRTGKVPGAKTIADVRSFYEGKVPMKRGCTGKDLVRALFYVVEQEYETGQAVPVTGGQVMLH